VNWWEWVLVGIAGAVGAPLRFAVDTVVTDRTGGEFPYGTLVVNVSGSFVLGLLTGLAIYHGLPDAPTVILGMGLVGAYTTYSTFTFETIALFEEGERVAAVRNLLLSAVVGAVAAAAGLAAAAL
jgi:fluoride exporter